MNLQALGVKLSRYREQLTETLDEVAEATGSRNFLIFAIPKNS